MHPLYIASDQIKIGTPNLGGLLSDGGESFWNAHLSQAIEMSASQIAGVLLQGSLVAIFDPIEKRHIRYVNMQTASLLAIASGHGCMQLCGNNSEAAPAGQELQLLMTEEWAKHVTRAPIQSLSYPISPFGSLKLRGETLQQLSPCSAHVVVRALARNKDAMTEWLYTLLEALAKQQGSTTLGSVPWESLKTISDPHIALAQFRANKEIDLLLVGRGGTSDWSAMAFEQLDDVAPDFEVFNALEEREEAASAGAAWRERRLRCGLSFYIYRPERRLRCGLSFYIYN